jgi:FixJ family two-component response regulator
MRSTATRLGAIAFFTKPFDDNQFLAAVRSALAMQTHA